MMDRIGGILGLAFYGAQAVALGGGLIVMIVGGNPAAWLRWTLPPLIAVTMALVIGLPAVGAATALWKVFKEG